MSQIFFVVNVESSTLQQFRKLFGESERAGMVSCSQMLQIYTREVTFENVQSAYCLNLIFLIFIIYTGSFAAVHESTKCVPTCSQEVFKVAAHVSEAEFSIPLEKRWQDMSQPLHVIWTNLYFMYR